MTTFEQARATTGTARPRPDVPTWLGRLASWSWRVLVVGAAVYVLAVALARLRVVVLPAIVSLFLASLFIPPARWLMRRGWPRVLATFAVLLAGLLVLVGIGALIVPAVASELGDLGGKLSTAVEDGKEWLVTGPLELDQAQVDRFEQRARDELGQLGGGGRWISGATLAIEVVAGIFLMIPLVFFFVKDGDAMVRWGLDLLPASHRHDAAEIGRRIWAVLGGYLRGVAVTGLVDGAVIGIGLALLGVPLVLPLVVLTFFGAFFPVVGATAAGAVAALVALVTNGPGTALAVVALTIAVQQIEGDVIAPLALGRTLKLHPIAILLALTAGGVLAGLVGAFLAVPLAAIAASVIGYLRERAAQRVDGTDDLMALP